MSRTITFQPIDRRPGTRPPNCPDCGASWLEQKGHACPPPEPTGFWARLIHRLRMWHSPPVLKFIVFDDEVPRPQPMPRPQPRITYNHHVMIAPQRNTKDGGK